MEKKTERRGSVALSRFRERVIHFLALRPYRRPDLLLQLKCSLHFGGRNRNVVHLFVSFFSLTTTRTDGEMKDEDREQLNHLLSTLTTQNKAGEYILSKQFYFNGDLNPDWPFYSKADSNTLKKFFLSLVSSSVDRSIDGVLLFIE